MATGIPVSVGELIDTTTINTWARGYLRKTTSKTVNTTTTATDLLNGEFTIPGGAMGTDKILRLTAWGDWKNDSSLDYDVPRFQVVFGGSTRLDTDVGGATIANSSVRFGWRIVVEIQNLGATNSQWWTIDGKTSGAVTSAQFSGFAMGNGSVSVNTFGDVSYLGGNTGAVDTASSCALLLKVINGDNGPNYETKLYGALCEII